MRRSHDSLEDYLSQLTDQVSGERHLRRRMTADGFYKGRLIKDLKHEKEQTEELGKLHMLLAFPEAKFTTKLYVI